MSELIGDIYLWVKIITSSLLILLLVKTALILLLISLLDIFSKFSHINSEKYAFNRESDKSNKQGSFFLLL